MDNLSTKRFSENNFLLYKYLNASLFTILIKETNVDLLNENKIMYNSFTYTYFLLNENIL